MPNSCPECRHILPSGRKCHQPALRGKSFCIHHCRSRNLVAANRARKHSIALPPLEDRSAVQMSLDVVLAALAAGKINRRTAATYAYAIKIGSDNLARMEQAPPPEPVEICRDEHGDVLAAEAPGETEIPSTTTAVIPSRSEGSAVALISSQSVTDQGCPIHATASPLHGWETTSPQSAPVILSDQSAALEAEDLPAVAGPSIAATDPGCPIHPTASPSDGWETTTPAPPNTSLDDLRDTNASHEYDSEPPTPLTKTELRKSRSQIEQQLKQQREALRYWSSAAVAKLEGENPQLVIDYIRQNIEKCESELKEISRLQAPDPPEPDPPL